MVPKILGISGLVRVDGGSGHACHCESFVYKHEQLPRFLNQPSIIIRVPFFLIFSFDREPYNKKG